MNNLEQMFLETFAPNSFLNNKIKRALLLQLVAPEPINILLIGDPGMQKTTILKEMAQLSEKARYCKGTKDVPVFSPSLLLSGAFANMQFLCFDKLDQASPQDQALLEEVINMGIGVLAAVNPNLGRFDPTDLVAKQIDLPSTLINGFDLIFPMKDLPNRERDEEAASLFLAPQDLKETNIARELLKKNIAQVRQAENPRMTDVAITELKEYYVNVRNPGGKNKKCVPITMRQLKTLVLLSKATARIRQSNTVSREDAQNAIKLLDYFLHQIAENVETGMIDIDRLTMKN